MAKLNGSQFDMSELIFPYKYVQIIKLLPWRHVGSRIIK